jgi:hypothetical protein
MSNKMRTALLIVLLCILPTAVSAAAPSSTKNFCLDHANKKEFDELLRKNPTDNGIIRLFAIRQGLCEMIGKQQILPAYAIDLWAHERQKMLLERTNKRLNRLTPTE